ncbi:hypothetical protein AAVH_04185 [Aphelenchoides avenae]|nr:hypothetical protein AAVH_04185 [Aphelenchus avenae]
MARTLFMVSIAIVVLVALALAAPEPKHKKFHGGHHPGHAKSRKPRSADPAAYGDNYGYDDSDDYIPDYNGYQDQYRDYYYGQFRVPVRGQRVGGRYYGGLRRPFDDRRRPAPYDYQLYQYQNQYPNDQQYYDNDSNYDKKERVKKDADKHRVKKDATSLLDKISASVAKVVKQ